MADVRLSNTDHTRVTGTFYATGGWTKRYRWWKRPVWRWRLGRFWDR